jgi:hypothetical protein
LVPRSLTAPPFARTADGADAATRTRRRSGQRLLSGTFRSVVPHGPLPTRVLRLILPLAQVAPLIAVSAQTSR